MKCCGVDCSEVLWSGVQWSEILWNVVDCSEVLCGWIVMKCCGVGLVECSVVEWGGV